MNPTRRAFLVSAGAVVGSIIAAPAFTGRHRPPSTTTTTPQPTTTTTAPSTTTTTAPSTTTTTAPAAPSGLLIGVSPGYGWEAPYATWTKTAQAAQIAEMAAAGVQMVRLDCYFNGTSQVDTTKDALIASLVAAGIRPHILLNNQSGGVPTPSALASWVTAQTRHYAADSVYSYELFNEPNGGAMSPAQYTPLLKAAYNAAKAVSPAMPFVAAGLQPATTGGPAYSPSAFLNGMYSAGAKGYFDAANIHPYCFPALPNSGDGWNTFSQQIPAMRAAMVNNDDSAKGIWVTEFGVPTGTADGFAAYSPAFQAQSIQIAYQMIGAWGYVPVFLSFSWQDNPTDGDFGLYTATASGALGTPKPALAAFTAR